MMAIQLLPEATPRAPEVLRALCAAPAALARLSAAGKPYAPLHAHLLTLDSEARLPQSRELAAALGISAAVFRRWLMLLYHDFIAAINERADLLRFSAHEYCLVLSPLNQRSFVFTCQLPVAPKVGEEVEVAFATPIVGYRTWYVRSIRHELLDSRMLTTLYLEVGRPNQYQRFLHDRARFEGHLPDELWLSDHQIEQRLREVYSR